MALHGFRNGSRVWLPDFLERNPHCGRLLTLRGKLRLRFNRNVPWTSVSRRSRPEQSQSFLAGAPWLYC